MKLNPKTTLKMFHLRTEPIKRSAGRSVVGASAYRTASKIKDDRLNKTFNYSSKKGVVKHDCFMYKDGNKINLDPSQLWNNAEQAEKRKDGRAGRDYIINLPYQWTDEQRIEAVENFSKWLAETYNVGVQYAIHLPDEQGDQRNHHVHILTTTRELDIDKDYKVTFGRKTDLEMENAELKKQGKPVTQDQIKNIRMEWANEANRMFDKAGLALRIDHRSYKDQNLYQIPTAKLGAKASGMERKGIQTDKGDYNRLVAQANAENWKGDIVSYMDKRLDELEQEIIIESRKTTAPTFDQSDKPTIGKPVEQSPPVATVEPVAPVVLERSDKAVEPPPPEYATAQDEYNALQKSVANKLFKDDLVRLQQAGQPLLKQLDDLAKNKPLLWGKKEWQQQHDKLMNDYNAIKSKHDDIKERGVYAYYDKARERIERDNPELVARVKQEMIEQMRADDERRLADFRAKRQAEPTPTPTTRQQQDHQVKEQPRHQPQRQQGMEVRVSKSKDKGQER